MTVRVWTWIAGATIVACVAILLADYVAANRQAPRDDNAVKNLQQQVKSDSALATKLAAEQKRITNARRSRKSRDGILAWILIAAASVFLTLAKQVTGQPSRPAGLVPVRAAAQLAPVPALVTTPHREARVVDLAFVDDLVAKEGCNKEAAITLLQAIQRHYRYLPDEAIARLSELTGITLAQFAGTSSFYVQFRRTPAGKHTVRVCHGTACHVAGARQVTDEIRRYLAIPENTDTDASRTFTVDEVACLGCCSLAPVLILDGRTAGRLTPSSACSALAELAETEKA